MPLVLGVGRTTASGLGLGFSPLCRWPEAMLGMEAVLSISLLVGVGWTGVTSALFKGVDLVALTRSASDSFLTWVDKERRPAEEATGSAAV